MRKRYGLKPNDLLIVEPTAEGILLKPAVATPIELYSDERLAEFEQNNEQTLRYALEKTNSRQALDVLHQRNADFTPLPAEVLEDYIRETRESWD